MTIRPMAGRAAATLAISAVVVLAAVGPSSARAQSTIASLLCKEVPKIVQKIQARIGTRGIAAESYCHPDGPDAARYRITLSQHERVVFWEVVEARVKNGREKSTLVGDYGIAAAAKLLGLKS